MRTPNRLSLVFLSLLLSVFAMGCGDDNPAGPGGSSGGGGTGGGGNGGSGGGSGSQELEGRWAITELNFNGTDVIAIGSIMEIEFTETGRATTGVFEISVTNDHLGWCDGDPDCTPSGAYEESSGGILVFFPQTEDEIVWNYEINSNSLSMEAGQDGVTLVMEADRI